MSASRRDFLGITAAMLATSATAPIFLKRTARAATSAAPSNDNILVVLQLTGGNDGLNTVIPFTDENYRRMRPTIHLADAKLHRLDDRVGFHPSLGSWKQLFDDGRAAIVQGVGYPHPNRSHFESMAIWHTAPADEALRSGRGDHTRGGWLARAIDRRATAAEQAAAIQALRIGDGPIPAALLGCRAPVPSLTDVVDLRQSAGFLDHSQIERQARIWRGSASDSTNPFLKAAAESSLAVHATSRQLENLAGRPQTAGNYPDSKLGQQFRLISELLQAGFSSSIYYTELEGFDTHSRQLNNHQSRLSEAGSAVQAFVDDVELNVPGRPVLVLVFSEFGRRVAENASAGTDHGTAAPVFLFGSHARSGIHGSHPDLEGLVDGDPEFAIDFRELYATVLEDWLDLPSREILGTEYQRLDILTPS